MPRFLVGIDLGTTNCAMAYVDLSEKTGRGGPTLHPFPVPQLVAPGDVQALPLLPSFLYLPGPHDLPAGSTALPWDDKATEVVGSFARNHGAKVPGRQVTSAKSWLCHPGVDRTAPLLPWGAPPDVPRLSPLDVSAKYLKHLVDAWNQAPGRKPDDRLEECQVVVTVPASFDDTARNLTAEAAKRAGLKHVSLLEEPQAAFYAWLGTHPPKEATKVRPGMRCAVVDVGGGTSDFSLIRAIEGQGDLAFEREAVGEHLLLGGDNMDLALAKAAEAKMPSKPDPAQFGALIQACRAAKEQLLGPKPPKEVPVTVVGRGRSVVGGTVSVNVTKEDVTKTLFDGFFPSVPYDAQPTRGRAGLQEMGLPYVADPAVTKHLAAFLNQHAPANEPPELLLFNGGVFQPESLRDRLIEVMRGWYGQRWNPLILTSPSLDLAVAWGAAYFAWLKHSGGARIGGGIPRSYYVGLDSSLNTQHSTLNTVLCVVPRHLQEGEEIAIAEPVLELALGEPVSFPLFTSAVRGNDKPGEVLQLKPEQVKPLPPLHTILRGGKRSGIKRVPITLAAKCTEIGTLELFCVSKEGNRWKLEFNVRDVLEVNDEEETSAGPMVVDVFPEEKLRAAGELIRTVYNSPLPNTSPKGEGLAPPSLLGKGAGGLGEEFSINYLKALVPLVPLVLLFLAGPPLNILHMPQRWMIPYPSETASAVPAGGAAAYAAEQKLDARTGSRLIGLAMIIGVGVASLTVPRKASQSMKEFFAGAGYGFTHIISLIVVANAFGKGIEQAGLAKALGELIAHAPTWLVPLAAIIPCAFAAISGSGMASTQSLYGFFHGPAVDHGVDPSAVGAVVSIASAAGRTMSPVAAVGLMCCTLSGAKPWELTRLVAPPLIAGLVVTVGLRMMGVV
jgi:hypothetical protein